MASGFIEAANAWKRYRRGRMHDSLRDLIPDLARSLVGRRTREELQGGEFWAVKDVSFRVGPGETLGIIGHNGAGKSTVLKLLTRVLTPDKGSCRVSGRIGALVEIAAGFHPDLTGRENLHLQGALMGMSKADIARKFADIVAFSGVSEFIDTPVKRYSSGMHARLGFSIAAHLDPDVLIIDEILSVGDLEFQQQAFGRIRALATSGRPVVIVSHQLNRIEELCTRAIVMDHGGVAFEGAAGEAVRHYTTMQGAAIRVTGEASPVTIESVALQDGDVVRSGESVRVLIKGQVIRTDFGQNIEPVALVIRNADAGAVLTIVGTRDCHLQFDAPGPFAIEMTLQMNVPPGRYALQSVAFDKIAQTPIGAGPGVSLAVQESRSFLGLIQLNASMVFVPSFPDPS